MPTHREERSFTQSPAVLYAIAADVEAYPEYFPWVKACRVLMRSPEAAELLVELIVSFQAFTVSYVSRVRLTPPVGSETGEIYTTLEQGPFKHLVNHWRFVATPEGGTRVSFFVDFAFKSKLMEKVMGGVFEMATRKMISAFEARVEALVSGAGKP